jgi:hypothetical protein
VATPENGTVYTATKWGLRGLELTLLQELYGTGVGVFHNLSRIRPWCRDVRADTRRPAAGRRYGFPRGMSLGRWPRAVERGRPEITVAAGSVRVSAMIGGVAPVLVGRFARLAGAARVREAMLNAPSRGAGTESGG